ncbi:hypothetical protein H5410_032539 [Solanum commersonii]|uniref:Uncharacterized protein n=1 Tax=Solanum commersonii TaxID=4109 RepID=A0A9J5YLB7_SOLCO|nr:hypothetical protein H5410_032539 [Solanum commersonii]
MPDPITESSPSSVSATPAQTNMGVAGSSETPVVDRVSADFKFTKPKKFTQGAKSNVACAEDSGLQAGDRPMTQDQFHSLYQLLQNVKVGTEGEQTPMDTAAANCAGISHPSLSKSPKSFISVSLSSISWILDSGALEHMTSDINLLSNITMLPKPVYDPSVPLLDSPSTIPSPSTVSIPTSDTLPVRKSTRLHHPPSLVQPQREYTENSNYLLYLHFFQQNELPREKLLR